MASFFVVGKKFGLSVIVLSRIYRIVYEVIEVWGVWGASIFLRLFYGVGSGR